MGSVGNIRFQEGAFMRKHSECEMVNSYPKLMRNLEGRNINVIP